jgi:hypothetical protein
VVENRDGKFREPEEGSVLELRRLTLQSLMNLLHDADWRQQWQESSSALSGEIQEIWELDPNIGRQLEVTAMGCSNFRGFLLPSAEWTEDGEVPEQEELDELASIQVKSLTNESASRGAKRKLGDLGYIFLEPSDLPYPLRQLRPFDGQRFAVHELVSMLLKTGLLERIPPELRGISHTDKRG